MFGDGQLTFVSQNAPLSLVLGAGLAARSNILDLLGLGVGVAPQSIIGARSLFGADMGVDMEKTQLAAAVGTAFATATSCTLNVQFQAAPDTGAAGGYQPGAWTTLSETGYLPVANLTAGAVLARLDYPLAQPVTFQPRFISINFQTLTGASFTSGTIAYAWLVNGRTDLPTLFAPKNFVVA